MALPPAFHESLPYIDPEPSPEALAAARALVAAEEAASPPPRDALPSASEPFLSPAMAGEVSRVAAGESMQPLPLHRYEAQEPPSPESSSAAELRPVLENAYVSAAYLSTRSQNLALLDRHGRNAWLLSNYHLENDLRRLEAELADTKRQIDVVNATRAKAQQDVRAEMILLEDTWKHGVGRVLETEVAVEELKAQIREELKKSAQ
ncbi:hypothetical protein HIM_02276 [Hirsutella minnesotensis 3608]|nr:hypothetical protein HIM_02276 [Hirsutella minnesotensis 3608]